jgi:flagellar biosynthesis GTPase FlhF
MSEHFADVKVEVTKTDKETGEKTKILDNVRLMKGSYCCLTAIDEVITSTLINEAGKRSKRGVGDITWITEDNVMDALRLNKCLNVTFGRFTEEYSSSNKYTSQLKLDRKEVDKFIESKCLNGNSSVKLDVGGNNFLMFILHKSRVLLSDSAFQMSQCYNKSSIIDRNILFSIRVVFSPGPLQKALFSKVDNVAKRVKHLEQKEKEASDNSRDNKKETKKSKSTKTKSSSTKKNVKKEESDSEEENSDESEDENEEEIEEESESESDSDSDEE